MSTLKLWLITTRHRYFWGIKWSNLCQEYERTIHSFTLIMEILAVILRHFCAWFFFPHASLKDVLFWTSENKWPDNLLDALQLPLPSQSGIRPPGFGVQPRRRRTSSSSSVSSTSSTLSHQSNDLNETFVITKGSSSDIPSVPNVCPRKVPTTKASLKPVNGTNTLSKPTFTKPKGRPQPVKALVPPGISKKAPQTPSDPLKSSKVLRSTPARRLSGVTTEQRISRPQTPSNIQRSKSFTTPVKPSTAIKKRSSISTGQPVKSAQTPTRVKKSEVPLTPRRQRSATPKDGTKKNPTPVCRRSNVAKKPEPSKGKDVLGPTTPENVSSVPGSDTVTPPNPGKSDWSAWYNGPHIPLTVMV